MRTFLEFLFVLFVFFFSPLLAGYIVHICEPFFLNH